jgi:hypothetical protein
MIHRLQITVKDRLLAVGFTAIVVAFHFPLVLFYNQRPRGMAAGWNVLVVAAAALIALVFAAVAFWRGSKVQKLLAALFAVPLLAFVVLAFQIWLEMF